MTTAPAMPDFAKTVNAVVIRSSAWLAILVENLNKSGSKISADIVLTHTRLCAKLSLFTTNTRPSGTRKLEREQNMKTTTCPKCGTHLDEEENLSHDGYNGSPHAHGGRGSYGLGRHHYYFVCECGWSERPDKDREKASRQRERNRSHGRGAQTMNGLCLPKNALNGDDYEVLSCSSRQTLVERIADALASGWENPDRGSICGHSICASYTYTVVTTDCMARSKALAATGAFAGLRYSWDISKKIAALAKTEAVYDNDNH